MSGEQMDIFGGSTPVPEPKSRNPYDPPAYDYKTCWEDCAYCGAQLFRQKNRDPLKRIYTLCDNINVSDMKRFEWSAVCPYLKPKGGPWNKPATDGWEDY